MKNSPQTTQLVSPLRKLLQMQKQRAKLFKSKRKNSSSLNWLKQLSKKLLMTKSMKVNFCQRKIKTQNRACLRSSFQLGCISSRLSNSWTFRISLNPSSTVWARCSIFFLVPKWCSSSSTSSSLSGMATKVFGTQFCSWSSTWYDLWLVSTSVGLCRLHTRLRTELLTQENNSLSLLKSDLSLQTWSRT